MKARILISGVAIAIALTGCSLQRDTLTADSSHPLQVNQLLEKTGVPAVPPVDVQSLTVTTPAIQASEDENQALMEPVTLYELNPEDFEKKTNDIPSYDKGDLYYISQEVVDSYNEGHSPTMGDPLVRTMAGISNLIPYDYLQDQTISDQLNTINLSEGGKYEIITEKGIVFTELQRDTAKTRTSVISAKVPEWGEYRVTLKNGKDSDIQIIQKITFAKAEHTNIDLASKSLRVYSISEELLKEDVANIPYYSRGDIGYVTEEEIQSVNEGHSPWKATPLLTAEFMTVNLIPEHTDMDQAPYEIVRVENANQLDETTIVEVRVPRLGSYTITLKYAGNNTISFITHIEFQSD